MAKFDPRNVRCPNCGKAILKPIQGEDRVIGYKCETSCKSIFHVCHLKDGSGRTVYLAMKCNPAYSSKLGFADEYKNLEKALSYNKQETPFYSATYVIGREEE